MSNATVKLLRAAAEILGSEAALARHFNIGALLLRAYLEERRPLPDYLMLRAVDIVLEHVKQPAAAAPEPMQAELIPAPLPTSSD